MRHVIGGASVASVLALVLASGAANAAGFQLKEQSARYLGTAFAGATARADDIATIFYNPAGMTSLSGHGAQANLSYIAPTSEFSNGGSTSYFGNASTGGDGGDAVENAFLPSTYAMYSVNEDLKIGVSLTVPYGLVTEYDDGWIGRYHAIRSDLQTIDLQPTVAYRVVPQVSVAAGLNIQYASAELTNAIDFGSIGRAAFASAAPSLAAGFTPGAMDGLGKIEGDDVSFGYTLGVMFEPTDRTNIGVSYRSRVFHTLEGDASFSNTPAAFAASPTLTERFRNGSAEADLTVPDSVHFGVAHEIDDQWTVMADAAWTNWSLFRSLVVVRSDTGALVSGKEEAWEDAWFFSLGTTFKPTDQWELSLGVAFDQSPVPTSHRTPRVPDADRTWLALGAGYQVTEAIRLNASYTHIWVDNAAINDTTSLGGPLTDNLRGSYESDIDIVSIGGTIKF